MYKVIATPVNWKHEQIVHTFETLARADSAVETVKESSSFDCIKVEGHGIVRQVERDKHGEWRHTIDRDAERDNVLSI